MPLVGRWSSVATVTESVPGRRFAFVIGRNPNRPNSRWRYTFEPSDVGSKITESWEMVREPPAVLIYYRLIGQEERVARGVEETLRRLKVEAEAL
jgi:hypothetical protein